MIDLNEIYQEILKTQNLEYSTDFKATSSRFANILANNEELTDDDLELLIQRKSNGIASLGQGSCRGNDFQNIKKRWHEIYEIIKRGRSRRLTVDEYEEIRGIIKNCCDNTDRKIIVNRMLSAFFPEDLSATSNEKDFKIITDELKKISDYPDIVNCWLSDNYNFIDYCNSKINVSADLPLPVFSWNLKDYIDNEKENLWNKIRGEKSMESNIYVSLLMENHNIILHGAPGTGKTHLAKEIAKAMGCSDEEIGFCQFHPSYDYTDFVEGLRPNDKGSFERINGVFKDFCAAAIENQNKTKTLKTPKNYVFIIDEINRGELSKIFGELFFSIDPGYRGLDGKLKTQYQNLIGEDDVFADGFYVPDNVYIIGTMNDIDRSVESMDFAMRRRFTFVEVTAKDSAENMRLPQNVIDIMTRVNDKISTTEGLNSSYHIGGSYFLKNNKPVTEEADLKTLWEYKIGPLVYEYLRGMDEDGSKYSRIKEAYFGENERSNQTEPENNVSIESK